MIGLSFSRNMVETSMTVSCREPSPMIRIQRLPEFESRAASDAPCRAGNAHPILPQL